MVLAQRTRSSPLVAVARVVTAPRFLIYACCTLLVMLTAYRLGKDMAWDTLDYHFYSGFSALHDRFGQDYFAAGGQSYLNPYVLVPFYALAVSGLTALQVALILAAVQSVILWLVYELAAAVAPPATSIARVGLGICAVALAYANQVLIAQFGSSFADVLTAELVLAGWLLLVQAVRTPHTMRVVYAGLLLGCATALKMTNSIPAVSAGVMVLFIPGDWRTKLRHAALYVMAGMVGAAAVAAPWSIRLEEHFGNPFFPLLNNIFHSSQYTIAPVIDHRFIPRSFGEALWRPFAMVSPRSLIHTEYAAPDLRYALLLAVALFALIVWGWKRRRGSAVLRHEAVGDGSGLALAALGSGLLFDWILWLRVSGNSRYFIPMACVTAVVSIALLFRCCAQWPKVRNYVLATVFVVQFYQLRAGTTYPQALTWDPAPWFQVSVPRNLAVEPALYFSIGVLSNSFLVPYLAPGSGFISLDGDYTLGPDGANGRHIKDLIARYSPHLRMLVRDVRLDAGHDSTLPNLVNSSDALEPFGLQLDTSHCARIVVRDVSSPFIVTKSGHAPAVLSPDEVNVGHFVTCSLKPAPAPDPAMVSAELQANLVLDRLEDACPELFQPRRPATYMRGTKARGYVWERQYPNTDMFAWVDKGWVAFQAYLSPEGYAGPESAWAKGPVHVVCGRGPKGDFLHVTGLR